MTNLQKLHYINIHTHNLNLNSNIHCIYNLFHTELEIAQINPKNLYSIGIHPWQTENIDILTETEKILKFASLPNIIAIGECGIDKLKGTDLINQTKAFESQAMIAEQLKKPIIIHCVKAFDEIIEIKRKIKPTVSWIIHGYRQSPELAKQLINEGFILSFGEKVLNNEQLTQTLPELLKSNTFFLETDNIDNKAVLNLYSQFSKILAITETSLIEQIATSFENVFKTSINTHK